jgi:hypothetical protein
MQHVQKFARLAILPALALCLLASGCGEEPPNLDPVNGQKLKQARINAYGKNGYASEKGVSTVSGGGSQGAARAAAQRGGH